MSEPRDPNQPYVPAAYPRMLYVTPEHHLIVQDAAEEARARSDGYTDFANIDHGADGLETLSHEHLIDAALGLIRSRLAKTAPQDIIADIRAMREAQAEAAAPERAPGAAPDFDAMTDDGLRAFIVSAGAEPAHHRAGRPKLLEFARAAYEASANPAAE